MQHLINTTNALLKINNLQDYYRSKMMRCYAHTPYQNRQPIDILKIREKGIHSTLSEAKYTEL